jgi:hypothetical protein
MRSTARRKIPELIKLVIGERKGTSTMLFDLLEDPDGLPVHRSQVVLQSTSSWLHLHTAAATETQAERS